MEQYLLNKTVIVTGGAGGLGSVFSEAVGSAGANVVVLGRNLEKAEKFTATLRGKGYPSLAISADVTNVDELTEAADKIMATFGSIDVLINNAGGNHPNATTENRFASETMDKSMRDFFKTNTDDMTSLLNLNIMGTMIPTQVFAKYMKTNNDASILNISSMTAFKPLTKIPAYSAAKAGVNSLTQWLAVYFASVGIRCNAIAPGFFTTDQNRQLLFNEDGTPTARTALILDHTPMGRFGEAEELVGALHFLLNPSQSKFITGIILPIDGGFSAFSGV